MHLGFVGHRGMHVTVMVTVDRRHADDQLCNMVIVVAIVDRTAEYPPPESRGDV